MNRAESEFLDIVEWDWAQFPTGSILHAADTFDGDDGLIPVGGQGVSVCGRSGRLGIPGIFSRMGAPRCKRCCTVLGWPSGVGSPKNVEELRPLAEARLSRWQGWKPTSEAAALLAEAEREMAAFVETMKAK